MALLLFPGILFGQADGPSTPTPTKMKVEIWSDVMCPFCYIGKRRFEQAMARFPHADAVEVEWKSFQLNPQQVTDPNLNAVEYLAAQKGWSVDYSRKMHDNVVQMAAEVGLAYDFDKAVVANSFDAHRLLQLAKAQGKGDEMEERLFRAYFSEGANTADHTVLVRLATEVGLDAEAVRTALSSGAYADGVRADLRTAQELGINAVPCFVFDRKYAVSGAQAVEFFLKTMDKAWADHSR